MVVCTKCKFGRKSCLFDHYTNETYEALYCNATEDWYSIGQAEEDVPCDLYVEKLDDHKTEESGE